MFQLFFHQETMADFAMNFVMPAVDACARCAEPKGVVHINIAEFRECFGKFRIVCFLFRLKPDILSKATSPFSMWLMTFFRNLSDRVVAEK